jgi:hypothetical protein
VQSRQRDSLVLSRHHLSIPDTFLETHRQTKDVFFLRANRPIVSCDTNNTCSLKDRLRRGYIYSDWDTHNHLVCRSSRHF